MTNMMRSQSLDCSCVPNLTTEGFNEIMKPSQVTKVTSKADPLWNQGLAESQNRTLLTLLRYSVRDVCGMGTSNWMRCWVITILLGMLPQSSLPLCSPLGRRKLSHSQTSIPTSSQKLLKPTKRLWIMYWHANRKFTTMCAETQIRLKSDKS